MRIYLIVVEEPFFHPSFVDRLITARGPEIAGITVVPDKSRKSFFQFLRFQWHFWGAKGFIVLSVLRLIRDVARHVKRIVPFLPGEYEVAAVARRHGVPVFFADNVNAPDHLEHLRRADLDLIVSANGQIFRKDLLAIPRIGCLNRHSALLPRYGGLWPVFRAAANGESKIGVSVHWMKEKLDAGDIVAFREIDVTAVSTVYSLYAAAFDISADVVCEALDRVRQGRMFCKRYDPAEASYFGMPTIGELKTLKSAKRIRMI